MFNYIMFSFRVILQRNLLAIFAAVIILLPLEQISAFVPGDLDPTFGLSGTVITPLTGNSSETILDSVIQPDGKIIVVGGRQFLPNVTGADTIILRYNPNGTLDNTFASGGIKVVSVASNSNDGAQKVALQPDGKIVVAGTAITTNSYDFFLLRLHPNGTDDFSFGSGGKVVTAFNGASRDELSDMIIQSDGKILTVGRTCPDSCRYEIALARYNSDGSLDTSFGNGGKVIQIFGIGDDGATEVEVQADGKIVVVGVKSDTVTTNTIVLRYNSDGSLDTDFDGDGYIIIQGIAVTYLAIQSDGKYVTAGTTRSSPTDLAIARFNPDGTPDTGFDGDGRLITPIGVHDENPTDLLLQPDGKILIIGGYIIDTPTNTNTNRAFLARFNMDGSFDSTFGNGGKVYNITSGGRCITLQPDGKIINAGSILYHQYTGTDIALTRFTANGLVDVNFGFIGFTYTSFQYGIEQARAIAIQPDNKIIAAGEVRNGNGAVDFIVARYNSHGELDTTFGNGSQFGFGVGYAITSLNNLDDGINAVAVQADGKIVAAGYSGRLPNADMAVVRYNTNGSLDTSFGPNGRRIIQLSGNGPDIISSVLIQPDGRIVLVGYTSVPNGVDFAVLRLTKEGLVDPTFSDDGVVTTPVGSTANYARSAALQPDGKIIAVGNSAGLNVKSDFALARFNTDGSLDKTFGNAGKVFMPSSNTSGEAYDVALQQDGKIVAAGITPTNSQDIRLTRYNINGSIDMGFGQEGSVTTDVQGGTESGESIVVQPNGKIIIAGTTSISSEYDFAVLRYNVNGSLDLDFGNNGIVTNDYGNKGETFYAAGLQSNGKLVAVGGINIAGTRNIALSRYILDSRTQFDFDGDGQSDISIYRDGIWWYGASAANGQHKAIQFGAPTDKLVPADYDGDSKTDPAVFRDGYWHILKSSDNSYSGVQFGFASDIPQPGDYDGDGKADVAVYRPTDGYWYILQSREGFRAVKWGAPEDKPVAADFDGDGKTDIAVFRPSDGTWYLLRSRDGFGAQQWGASTDKPMVGDYDGDGKSDYAVFRPSNGTWYVLGSLSGFKSQQWGLATDKPVPADYDGDGKTDFAVARDGTWYQLNSTTGFKMISFGYSTDILVPNSYIR